MNKLDSIQEYIKTVCDQIRWKKAHSTVADELETHILDQRDTFIRNGQDYETATKDALTEMGNAVDVGTLLDHSYRPHMNWKALLGMLAIIVCSCLLSVLLYRTGYWRDSVVMFFSSIAFYLVFTLPFCLIDFTYYAKIPKILFFTLAACLVLASAGVNMFWRVEAIAIGLLPFASLLMLFSMRGGGFSKFILCGILFVVLPCIGYFLFLYFRYYGSWRVWAITESFVVFVLSSVAMLVICVCNGFFNINKKKALIIILIPSVVFMVLFLLYSNFVQQYHSTFINSYAQTGHSPMNDVRQMIQDTIWFGNNGKVPYFVDNDITRVIYLVGWLPFLAIVAVIAGFSIYLFKLCIRQRSVLGRTLSLMCWTTLAIPTVLGLLNAVGLMPNAFHLRPSLSIYECMVLGLLVNIFRNGDVVHDHKIKAVA